jgi:hypothetical protein
MQLYIERATTGRARPRSCRYRREAPRTLVLRILHTAICVLNALNTATQAR